MLVSANQLSNYNIPSDLWFRDRDARNTYFQENPSALVASIYDAICGNPNDYTTGLSDPTAQVWELEQYNGTNWQTYAADSNYNLVITTAGLDALSSAVTGNTVLSLRGIKIIDTCLTNPSIPLAMWTDSMFLSAGELVFSVGVEGDSAFVHNGADDLNQILTWRYNSTTGGLQYTITLPAEGLGSVSNSNESIWNVGAIGLYVQNDNTGQDVLFGIATLKTPAQKIGNDIDTIGNSFKFYINTVLTNLGYVQDLSVIPEYEGSLPEVANETFLQYPTEATQRPFNMYLVKDLYGSGLPALAVQTEKANSSATTINWHYFQPSDNFISVDPKFFDSTVFNYAFVYWDNSANKYKLGDGATSSKKPVGIRVGNSILTSGIITNASTSYTYNTPTLQSSGSGYTVGDQLLLIYSSGGETQLIFKLVVTSVNTSRGITGFDFIGPKSGDIQINNITIDASYDPRSVNRSGSGARFTITSANIAAVTWNLSANTPYYCGTGANVGKPVVYSSTVQDAFLGTATGAKSISLGLNTDKQATEDDYGTVRYATNEQVQNTQSGSGEIAVKRAITPRTLKDNYFQITKPTINIPGYSASNPIIVNSFTRFSETIVGKGYTSAPSDSSISFHGVAYRAQWADLAEYYESDIIYEPGTLISFGEGDKEITAASTECNGIISTNPGYQLGEKLNDHYQLVALCGRVPVLFDGKCKIRKGDKVYLSKFVKGRASTIENGKAIGRVIERNPGTMTKIQCVVKIDF